MAVAFKHLTTDRSTLPMEARLLADLPDGEGWQFEPKWDGFRCLAFKDGADVALMSKSGKPLARYFPELVASLARAKADRFVVDGEIILPIGGVLSFAALQARLHPAASRIERLSRETPVQLMLFDCLQSKSRSLIAEPLDARRSALEALASGVSGDILLSPMTYLRSVAEEWLARSGGALDGVMAKRRDEPYRSGERAMFKRKVQRSADCVVGGYRLDNKGAAVASLLLGLFDSDGLLHHVGYTSSFSAEQRGALRDLLTPLVGDSAFTGSAPGGQSRWSREGRSTEWLALQPTLVAEVGYDQVTGDRFRHGTTFRRWRPDKAPAACTFDQLQAELRPEQLAAIVAAERR